MDDCTTMRCRSFYRTVAEALDGGIYYLLRRQSNDGFWRDYQLPPGMSEAWSTAWVGWCLAHNTSRKPVQHSLRMAAFALRRVRKPTGWGYNRGTSADADSTAWSVRFLEIAGIHNAIITTHTLESYLDGQGRAHTFLEKVNGSWADAHADVTPVVGLALLASGASVQTIQKVRRAILNACSPDGVWKSFWWPTDAYASLWSLEFLRRTGGIPKCLVNNVRRWLERGNEELNTFDCSFRLLIVITLGLYYEQLAFQLTNRILDLSNGERGWEPSSFLRLPPKFDEREGEGDLFPDTEGLMTTSIACLALTRWLATDTSSRP